MQLRTVQELYEETTALKSVYEVDENGTLQGEYKEYYKNGQLKFETTYKHGKPAGDSTRYYEDGKLLARGFFINANQSVFEEYYKSGKLKKKSACKGEQLHGPYEEYHENGKIKKKGAFLNGFQYGLFEEFYISGQLKEKVCYDHRHKHGAYESYYENGKTKSKGYYVNGEKLGPWVTYDQTGKLIEKAIFESGKKVRSSKAFSKEVRYWEESLTENRSKRSKGSLSDREITVAALDNLNQMEPTKMRQDMKRSLVAAYRRAYPKTRE